MASVSLVSTILDARPPDMPMSVIFTTSPAAILVEECTQAPDLSHISGAEVLIAECRLGRYILMVATAHSTVPLLLLGLDEIKECLSCDEEDLSVSMTVSLPNVEATDEVGSFNLPRQTLFRVKFKNAGIFLLFRHYVCCLGLKGDEIEAILDFSGNTRCVEHTHFPRAFAAKPSLGLCLPPTVLGAAFTVGAAFGLAYVLFLKVNTSNLAPTM